MLSCSNLAVRLGDHLVFEHVSLSINSGDRLAIIGANGAGKTTLLCVLAGALLPDAGSVFASPEARIGYLPQGFAENIDGDLASLVDAHFDGLLASEQNMLEAAALAGAADPPSFDLV